MKAISFARDQAFAFVLAPKPYVRIQSLVENLGGDDSWSTWVVNGRS